MRTPATATLIMVLLAAGAFAATARADGLPVLGIDVGLTGVTTRSGAARYVTLSARGQTVVARVRTRGGTVTSTTTLKGNFTIPAVAYDGSASGLAADGRTLVLIQPRQRFPRKATTLAVVNTRQVVALRHTIRLHGDFSFDAISPRGRLIYLIQYLSPVDPTQYAVRAYDLTSRRLLPDPVVDPSEPDEEMRGQPLSRETSNDGRWAYTLYGGAAGAPFVHALDTATATARCIDLPSLAGLDLSAARLHLRGVTATLEIGDLARIDTGTLTVTPE